MPKYWWNRSKTGGVIGVVGVRRGRAHLVELLLVHRVALVLVHRGPRVDPLQAVVAVDLERVEDLEDRALAVVVLGREEVDARELLREDAAAVEAAHLQDREQVEVPGGRFSDSENPGEESSTHICT